MIFSRRGSGKEATRLRLWFLIPLLVVLLATEAFIELSIQRHGNADIDRNADQTALLAEHLYQEEIDASADMLGAAMEVLATDRELRDALARRNRARLLQRAAPLFDELRKKYSITHFYFSDSDRVNILRVHQPARFGDVIGRETTLQAQRSKQTSYGVELGPLGTFTLRLVAPWLAPDGQVLGYVELGMEIDHVLRTVQHIGKVRAFVLVGKQYIDRKEWEAGMRMLGRLPDWERFPDVVVNNPAMEDLPAELTQGLQQSLRAERKLVEPLREGVAAYRAVFLPLKDAAGRSVGRVVLLLDISTQMGELSRLLGTSMAAGTAASVLLLGFFYWLLGVVGQRLDRDRQRLRELASRDGLTGLYNHRMYYRRLDEEFVRIQRTKALISVLMLDIDHFKQVNDRYGHLVGDMVLKGLSELVRHSCRGMDSACRYGGEEISVILPETDGAGAVEIAERLRKAIETQRFQFNEGDGHVTVSIGVATSSAALHSSTELTASADRALYRAKEGGRNRVECAVEMPS